MTEAIEIERRWLLVDSVDMEKLYSEDGWNKLDLTQFYLENYNKESERLRVSKSDKGCVYTHTVKSPLKIGQLEKEEEISESRFIELMSRVNLKHQTIWKTRYFKTIDGLKYEVDQFIHPFAIRILEVEVTALEQEVKIPECLGRYVEITGDKSISNFNMSLKPKVAKKNLTKYVADFLKTKN